MIAKVYVRQKVKDDFAFDYEINEKVEKLGLVEVPFSGKKIWGLVAEIKQKSNFRAKAILRNLTRTSVFTPLQIELAKKIAKYYLSSFGTTIFGFLPKLNISDLKKMGTKIKIVKNKKNENVLILGEKSQRIDFFIQKKFESENKKHQSLVIVPSIEQANSLNDQFIKINPSEKVFLWHSKIKSFEKALIWQKILNGEEITVIGTRHALFLPFTKLKNIYIDDPSNLAYQDDQEPYYNAFRVAKMLSSITLSNLYIGDYLPDINSFISYLKKDLKIIELKEKLKIYYFNSFDYQVSAGESKNKIEDFLKHNKKIVIIGQWSDRFKYKCAECNKFILCNSCKSEYYFAKDSVCKGCKKINEITCCDYCKSSRIQKVGFLKEQIESIIKTNFNSLKNFYFFTPKELAKSNDFFNLALIVNFDFMSNLPFLRNRQRIFRLVKSLKAYGVGEVILYSLDAEENQFINTIKNNNWSAFLKKEIAERRKLALPPFTRSFLIKLRVKNAQMGQKKFDEFCLKIKKIGKVITICESDYPAAFVFVNKSNLLKFEDLVKTKDEKIYIYADPPEFN